MSKESKNQIPLCHPVNNITLVWRCDKCNIEIKQPLGEITESGIAICSDCGDDMELQDDVIIR